MYIKREEALDRTLGGETGARDAPWHRDAISMQRRGATQSGQPRPQR